MTDEETIVMSEESIRQEAAEAAAAAAQQAQSGFDDVGFNEATNAAQDAAADAQQFAGEAVAAAGAQAGAIADDAGDAFGAAMAEADGSAPAPAPEPAAAPAPEPVAAPAPAAAATTQKKKKRRKIDLKSRLSSVRGKARPSTAGRAPSTSFPPPPQSGPVPAPKLFTGIAPRISSPFAPPEPEVKPTAQQQTIKIEVGEEIIEERKKASKRTLIAAAIAGVVALGMGFFVGQVFEKGSRGRAAVAGANALANDVDTANKAMADLSDALRAAGEKLGNDEYPDELVDLLKNTNIPFSSDNFRGRGVAGLPAQAMGSLLKYTSGVDALNKQKDRLKNILGAARPQVEKYIAQKKKPVVNFSVVFARTGKKIVVELAPHIKPFEQGGSWPDSYKVKRLVNKKAQDVEVIRLKGDKDKLFGDKPVAIPVEEKTVANFTSRELVRKLRTSLSKTKALITGVQSPRPDESTNGLIKDGERLIKALKAVGSSG